MIPEIVALTEKLKSRVETGRISLEYPSAFELRVVPSAQYTFPILVSFDDDGFRIQAADWRATFETVDAVSSVICWLLTPYYRIVRSSVQGSNIATWVEIYTDQGWEGTEYVYFVDQDELSSPIDGADQIFILQQAVFLDSKFPEYYPAAHLDQAGYPVGTILGETTFEIQNGEWHPIGVPLAE